MWVLFRSHKADLFVKLLQCIAALKFTVAMCKAAVAGLHQWNEFRRIDKVENGEVDADSSSLVVAAEGESGSAAAAASAASASLTALDYKAWSKLVVERFQMLGRGVPPSGSPSTYSARLSADSGSAGSGQVDTVTDMMTVWQHCQPRESFIAQRMDAAPAAVDDIGDDSDHRQEEGHAQPDPRRSKKRKQRSGGPASTSGAASDHERQRKYLLKKLAKVQAKLARLDGQAVHAIDRDRRPSNSSSDDAQLQEQDRTIKVADAGSPRDHLVDEDGDATMCDRQWDANDREPHDHLTNAYASAPVPDGCSFSATAAVSASASCGAGAGAGAGAVAAPVATTGARGGPVTSTVWVSHLHPLDAQDQGGLSEVGVGVLRVEDERVRWNPYVAKLVPGVHQCIYKRDMLFCAQGQTPAPLAAMRSEHAIMRRLMAAQRQQRLQAGVSSSTSSSTSRSPDDAAAATVAISPHLPVVYGHARLLVPGPKKNGHQPFFVSTGVAMEWVRGPTLHDVFLVDSYKAALESRWQTNKCNLMHERIKIAIQMVRAVRALHRHKILHRDIKPGNMVLSAPALFLHMLTLHDPNELNIIHRQHLCQNDGTNQQHHLSRTDRLAALKAASPAEQETYAGATLRSDGFRPSPSPAPAPSPVCPDGVVTGDSGRLVLVDFNAALLLDEREPSAAAAAAGAATASVDQTPSEWACRFRGGTRDYSLVAWFMNAPDPNASGPRSGPSDSAAAAAAAPSHRVDTPAHHCWPTFDHFALGLCITDILTFQTLSINKISAVHGQFANWCRLQHGRGPRDGDVGRTIPSVSEFLHKGPLSESAGFDPSYLAGNQEFRSLLDRSPRLSATLHAMTRQRMSVAEEDSGYWKACPIPSLDVVDEVLTQLLPRLQRDTPWPDAIQRKLEQHYKLTPVRLDLGLAVQSDGDCTFLAFIHQVQRTPQLAEALSAADAAAAGGTNLRAALADESALRTAVVDFIDSHLADFTGAAPQGGGAHVQSDVLALREAGRWSSNAADFVLLALCTMFQCDATLIQSDQADAALDLRIQPIALSDTQPDALQGGALASAPARPVLFFVKHHNHYLPTSALEKH